jgi:hypothetical protein
MADLSRIPWNRFPERAAPRDLVSRHFALAELTRSETAAREGIDNSFQSIAALHAAVHLCRRVLEPLRAEFGAFRPNSVYRSQALERALKSMPGDWISSSQHAKGEACDVSLKGISTLDLAHWAAENLEFDQIICECYDPAKGPHSGWVHISLKAPGTGENRGKLLSYVRDVSRGDYVYVDGLRADA